MLQAGILEGRPLVNSCPDQKSGSQCGAVRYHHGRKKSSLIEHPLGHGGGNTENTPHHDIAGHKGCRRGHGSTLAGGLPGHGRVNKGHRYGRRHHHPHHHHRPHQKHEEKIQSTPGTDSHHLAGGHGHVVHAQGHDNEIHPGQQGDPEKRGKNGDPIAPWK